MPRQCPITQDHRWIFEALPQKVHLRYTNCTFPDEKYKLMVKNK